MKVIVYVGIFGGNVLVDLEKNGEAIISTRHEDFSVNIEEPEDKRVNAIRVHAKPRFAIDRDDGWEFSIDQDIYNKNSLIITRLYRSPENEISNRQYLTRSLVWKEEPKSGPLPSDAVRIPLFVYEKETVEAKS